jgi:GMP synthase-like glutamine amidotransferase
MRALVFGDDTARPGFVGERLEEHRVEIVEIVRGGENRLPSTDGFDIVVALGSVWSVYDPDKDWWMRDELALLREAFERDVPILGVCFGAQGLAAALDGEVRPAVQAEIGWFEVDTGDPAVIPPGPWFEWHTDTFTPPRDAVVLARSPVGPQAFRLGRHLAVQFHPEVDRDLVHLWSELGAHELEKHAVDVEKMLEETELHLERSRRDAHYLVDVFLDGAFGR